MRPGSYLIILVLFLAGGSVLAQREGAAPKPARHTVSIKDMKFEPASLEIKVGDTVAWTNNDDRDHTVSGSDGSFKSDNLKPGASYSFKFTKAGTFAYSCSYHPRMKGTINVKDEEPPKARG